MVFPSGEEMKVFVRTVRPAEVRLFAVHGVE